MCGKFNFLPKISYPLLGEKLTEAEVEEVTNECLDPEDEDGMINYVRKYLLQ